MGSPAGTDAAATLTAAEIDAIDDAIAALRAGSAAWAALPLAGRRALLDRTHATVAAAAADWAEVAASSKGLGPRHPLRGEEWLAGPYAALVALEASARTLAALERGESPIAHAPTRPAPGGRTAVEVFPVTGTDRLLLSGYRAEVWLRPGVAIDEARRTAGLAQLDPTASGGVGLVLGAGNVTAIPVLDVLHELLAAGRASLLKVNPTQDALVPVFERALAPLVEAGLLRIVTGGGEVGAFLTRHPSIDHVHVTGSEATFDAIVWGTGDEAERRRRDDDPRLTAPITAELGGVSPVIVVPGRWSTADLRFQAEHVVTMRLHNNGHNCIAGQVVLVSADWPQRREFLVELRRAYARAPRRPGWYPGTAATLDRARRDHPGAAWFARGERALVVSAAAREPGGAGASDRGASSEIGTTSDATAQILRSSADLRRSADAGSAGASHGTSEGARSEASVDPIETIEYFAPVLGVVELPGLGQEFLDAAVAHANERLAGTLGANLLIDPATQAALGAGLEEAVADLRYGTVAINAWTAFGFLTPTATWGAFPGGTLAHAPSGIGTVHNALLLDDVERTVVRGPFRPFPRSLRGGGFTVLPKPPWFVTARTGAAVCEGFTRFRGDGDRARLAVTLAKAFRA